MSLLTSLRARTERFEETGIVSAALSVQVGLREEVLGEDLEAARQVRVVLCCAALC